MMKNKSLKIFALETGISDIHRPHIVSTIDRDTSVEDTANYVNVEAIRTEVGTREMCNYLAVSQQDVSLLLLDKTSANCDKNFEFDVKNREGIRLSTLASLIMTQIIKQY